MVRNSAIMRNLCFTIILLLSSFARNVSAQEEVLEIIYDDSYGNLTYIKNFDGYDDYLLLGNSTTDGYSKIVCKEPRKQQFWNIPENNSIPIIHNNHLYFSDYTIN